MVDRKVRWNRITDPGEQVRMRHLYLFAILNEPREIMRIKQRILEQILHFDDFLELGDFGVPNSNGLHCEIFSFTSDIEDVPKSLGIYAGDFKQDRDLYPRKTGNWDPYVERLSRS